jgi:hypothetical protein
MLFMSSPCEWGPGSHGVHNAIHDIFMPTVPFFGAPCQHQKPRHTAWAFDYLLFSQFSSPIF